MSTVVGSIAELWRFPRKSTRGQRLHEVWCGARGLEGDRGWAIRGGDGELGSGKTTRRFRRMPDLLSMASFIEADGAAWIRFADGSARRLDDPFSTALVGTVVGESVSLVQEEAVSHFDDGPLHLLDTGPRPPAPVARTAGGDGDSGRLPGPVATLAAGLVGMGIAVMVLVLALVVLFVVN